MTDTILVDATIDTFDKLRIESYKMSTSYNIDTVFTEDKLKEVTVRFDQLEATKKILENSRLIQLQKNADNLALSIKNRTIWAPLQAKDNQVDTINERINKIETDITML